MILQNDNGTLTRYDGGDTNNASAGQGYGTCSTAESTTEKVATLADYELTLNGVVAIMFTNAVPANSTLNINSKGAKPIYYKGSAIPSDIIRAGDTATFFYDGSYYHLTSVDRQMEFNFSTHAAMNAAITAGTVPNGAICHTDKTDYEVVGGAAKPIIKHGENLLDNWYFVGGGSQQGGGQFPINQRGGYVVPPGVAYYVPGVADATGQTDRYYPATYYNEIAYDIYINNEIYVVSHNDVVPGYTGAIYGIDRWRSINSCITLENNGIKVNKNSFLELPNTFSQFFEPNTFVPSKYTFSIIGSGLNNIELATLYFRGGSGDHFFPLTKTDNFVYGTINLTQEDVSSVHDLIWFWIATNKDYDVTLQAVKLELGTEQTLAHQDANGNWVLNDAPPNFQQELAKCQRYQLVVTTAGIYVGDNDGKAITYIYAQMRARPTISFLSGNKIGVDNPNNSSDSYYDSNYAELSVPDFNQNKVAIKIGNIQTFNDMQNYIIYGPQIILDANL